MTRQTGTRGFAGSPPFPEGAQTALADPQLRANMSRATHTIRAKRDRVVAELDEWEDLRRAGEAIKTSALEHLDELLEVFQQKVEAAGGVVHWARDAAEANRIVVGLVSGCQVTEVVKVKSMTTGEIGLNQALEAAGITPYETDLAELIVQLGDDLPSHIVVPAIHRSRSQIRATFADHMGEWGRPAPAGLGDDPAELASAARAHLRERFLSADVAVCGANFLVAETGSVVVVESEGNGRMCLTLPDTLIAVAGIDKVIPSFEDLDVFLQVLPRSATGERMNPYTSIWTGVTPGDGPRAFHVVLVDNGRSRALADKVGRQALRCIRCAACLNVCPVYERVGGHAYGSVYPGPIGAVLTPQLDHVATDDVAASLPYASTLCGACFDACPVRIDIPRLLVHLRGDMVDAKRTPIPATQEAGAMALAAWAFARPRRLEGLARLGKAASRVARTRALRARRLRLPGWAGGWSRTRAVPLPESDSFARWWDENHPAEPSHPAVPSHPAEPSAPPSVGRPRVRLHRNPPATPNTVPEAGTARAAMLARIGAALGSSRSSRVIPRDYRARRAANNSTSGLVELFAARTADYRATVTRIEPTAIPATLAALLAARASRSAVVPHDLPPSWTDGLAVPVTRDVPPLSVADLDATDTVITSCGAAIAETGTVILDGGAGQGRRAVTLIPDHHIVIVREDQIVAGVPDALHRIEHAGPQTWISGPSATSDIELHRVEGVHGPRHLDVVIVTATGG